MGRGSPRSPVVTRASIVHFSILQLLSLPSAAVEPNCSNRMETFASNNGASSSSQKTHATLLRVAVFALFLCGLVALIARWIVLDSHFPATLLDKYRFERRAVAGSTGPATSHVLVLPGHLMLCCLGDDGSLVPDRIRRSRVPSSPRRRVCSRVQRILLQRPLAADLHGRRGLDSATATFVWR